MSQQQINSYYNQVHQARRAGAVTEGALSPYFHQLISQYAFAKKYLFLREITIKSQKTSGNIRPDGVLMNDLRVHRGYWESKDTQDDIDLEIHKKIQEKGYPTFNILFEDTQTAVLIQGGAEVMRADINDPAQLHLILTAFVQYRPAEVVEFERALEAFKRDIPQISETFRILFEEQSKTNARYVAARNHFFELCKEEINPEITEADVREMLIQHILTEDLFTAIFDDADFLRNNIIAKELEGVINTVLTRDVRKNQLGEVQHYYKTLNATAASIADHHEKQKFLKTVYENFYKVYNPKGADRLGVVYTPNEIVRFMVESTDFLLEKHFNKNLHDKGVEILDPATGTGTFITDIIDYLPPQFLTYKYQHELHANEVAILPYYIANLNIEYTYSQKMGKYIEFPNICFVDTLDNTTPLAYAGKQRNLFGFNSENTERIKRQNERKISVIIGNPPYNANQQNFNDNNQNREYPDIDKRIKETFVKQSTATNKANLYDMYTRFYRWAMDRIDNTEGIICMITNSSFVDSRSFDGFRKCVQEEYDYAYIIDLGGNVRELSGRDGIFVGEAHTIFGLGAMVGIAIMFLVKTKDKAEKQNCQVRYIHPCNIRATRIEKLEWLKSNPLRFIPFERIEPSKKNNWINLNNNDFDTLLPLMDKDVKAGKEKKVGKEEKALFKLYSLGVATHRDGWVYDFDKNTLSDKLNFMIDIYQATLNDKSFKDKMTIGWDAELSQYATRKIEKVFNPQQVVASLYRPFTKKWFYFDRHFNGRTYQWFDIYNGGKENRFIAVQSPSGTKPFHVLASNSITDLHYTGDAQCLPLYRYEKDGRRVENITAWGLSKFVSHYGDASITKAAIFDYVYAVLHCPLYREKYALDLKREFPRVPFYTDFWAWSAKGKALMALHLDYESVAPHASCRRIEAEQPKTQPLPKLKADKGRGVIVIDENTHIEGIPETAWAYQLGNRSALEWVLDQYKEKTARDKTIAARFNTYRFADYKEEVVDLLLRVCAVSVQTVFLMDNG